jgi:hypothetical protein
VTKRADHPGGCAAEHCLKRLVALAKLIDPTYRRRRIAPCRSTRRRDDRQPTFRACPSTCATRWRSQASTRSAQPRKKGPRASRTCLLRRRYPAPNDGVAVKDLRPLTRSALAGQSLTPTPQPALPKNGGERQKKRSTIRISPSLTRPAPFRDDNADARTQTAALRLRDQHRPRVHPNLRRGHYELGVDTDPKRQLPAAFTELALAI